MNAQLSSAASGDGTAPRKPHLMIDLETMGNGHNAVISAVGAVVFDPLDPSWTGDRFYLRAELDDAVNKGKADGGTVAFWLRQADAPRLALMPPKGHKAPKLADVLIALAAFYAHAAAEAGCAAKRLPVWSNGATFDVIILEQAFAACGLEEPWDFPAVRDCRTIKDVADEDLPPRTGTHHNALDDALYQARWVAEAFTRLRAAPAQRDKAIKLAEDLAANFEKQTATIQAAHDARVTELLAANNAELDRRRESEIRRGEARDLFDELWPTLDALRREMPRTKATANFRSLCARLGISLKGPIAPDPSRDVVREIAAERHRQIWMEGWTPEKDDADNHGHHMGSMALFAAAYAVQHTDWVIDHPNPAEEMKCWGGFKPKTARANLIRAAALIIAEIERIDRLPVGTPVGSPLHSERKGVAADAALAG